MTKNYNFVSEIIKSSNTGLILWHKQIIKKIANFFGYDLIKLEYNQFSIETLLSLYFYKTPEDFFFVQIGANDGKTSDPVYNFIKQYKLSGILIEPQKIPFKKLKETYSSCENLIFANIAIGEEDGEESLYNVKESFKSVYNHYTKGDAMGISSFYKQHIREHLKKNVPELSNRDNVDEFIDIETVNTLSFDTFVQKYNVNRIDLLQIDA